MSPTPNKPAPRLITRSRRPRQGGATTGLIITISILSMLTIGAVWMGPSYLQASDEAVDPSVSADQPDHQQVIELLGALVSRSRGVVAAHERGGASFSELVVWFEDPKNPGVMDDDEIAVLTHSPLMRTIRLYTLAEAEDATEADPLFGVAADETPALVEVDTSDIQNPSFTARWRDRPDVESKVIVTGVDNAQFTIAGTDGHGAPLMRISLTWPADSTDGADEATIIVGVVLCTDCGGRRSDP